jgi:hypothetical protein
MNIPRFTAEASLYKPENCYQSVEARFHSSGRRGVIPQFSLASLTSWGGWWWRCPPGYIRVCDGGFCHCEVLRWTHFDTL